MNLALIAGFASQAYISLIIVTFMPIYLRNMGAEAFGLVGFFLMLQTWLQLLDLGMSSTFSREMSLYRAGESMPLLRGSAFGVSSGCSDCWRSAPLRRLCFRKTRLQPAG